MSEDRCQRSDVRGQTEVGWSGPRSGSESCRGRQKAANRAPARSGRLRRRRSGRAELVDHGDRRCARSRSSALCSLTSDLCAWTAGSTWRRPALPPLGGQYPGRGAVSRPSSEWGRVGPARCDHQVEPAVQRSDDRGQMTEDARAKPMGYGVRSGRADLSREAWSMGGRG
jgi:hypothetical protein